MNSPGSMARVRVDASRAHQTIDGFSVNINSKYWNDEKLIPTMGDVPVHGPNWPYLERSERS